MRTGTASHWSVRYRHLIARVRTGLFVTATIVLTITVQTRILLTADSRAEDDGVLDATLTTAALVLAPLVVVGLAVLVLRRSTPTYRQLAAETCVGLLVCDLGLTLLILRG